MRKVEMSLFAFERGRARLLGLILVFLPWLCLTRGGLKPFVGRPSNPGLSSFKSKVTQREALRRSNRMCNVWMYGMIY